MSLGLLKNLLVALTLALTAALSLGLGTAVAYGDTVSPAVSDTVFAVMATDLYGEATTYVTVADDTLLKVATNHNLGLMELLIANPGLDPWFPGDNRTLTLPTLRLLLPETRVGIVINLPEQRPIILTKISGLIPIQSPWAGVPATLSPVRRQSPRCRRLPSWRPLAELRAMRSDLPALMPPGPRNPLGKYALDLPQKGRTHSRRHAAVFRPLGTGFGRSSVSEPYGGSL